LGSIALGSLFIALLKTLQYFFKKWKKSKNPCCKVVGLSCFYCLRKIFELFTTYAMVHVAMFGHSYFEAARATVQLARASGLDAAVSNQLVEDIVGMGTFIGALLTGTLACVCAFAVYDVPLVVAVCMIATGLLAGYACLYIPLMALDSAVATVFTCWIVDPRSFRQHALHDELDATWRKLQSKKQLSFAKVFGRRRPNELPPPQHAQTIEK
jgi:hypothetical protein